MVRYLNRFAIAGTLGLMLGGAAQAADMSRGYPPLPPPALEMPPLPVEEFGTGWYLRGDLGYRMNKVDNVTNAGADAVISDDFDNPYMVGVGAGFKWQWLRADLTADYGFSADYRASTAALTDDYTAKIDSFTALANVYGDLGTWYGLTPYIGAGLGVAHLGASDFTQHSLAAVPAADSGSKWNLAWAYMAGISYSISPKFLVDLGYRHINMGDVTTGTDDYGNQLTFHDVAADEVRLGVRYLID